MHIVLLGGGINPNGQLPDQEFIRQRLQKAKELYEQLRAPIIISGGHSFLLELLPPRSEAAALQEALVKMGVPASAIQLEEQSQDTISNAYFVKKMLPTTEKELVVTTSDFHVERTTYIFRQVFGDAYHIRIEGAPSHLPSDKAARVVERQAELLQDARELFARMTPGDESFLADKFFSAPYYTKDRPAWVKQFVAKGQ